MWDILSPVFIFILVFLKKCAVRNVSAKAVVYDTNLLKLNTEIMLSFYTDGNK